jgi:hypothetical protein
MWTGWVRPLFVLPLLFLPEPVLGQEEAASRYYRYRSTEMSTGIYEEYEVRPRGFREGFPAPDIQGKGISRVAEDENRALNRTFLDDAHRGLSFYEQRRCVDCHTREANNNRHHIRHGITCRQCHGGEPIASVSHYYSRLNPIRKHTHVCSLCHPGSGASFALYSVHEPNPASLETIQSMPLLFYAFWLMVLVAVGTFAFFLPHALLWGIRELFTGKRRTGRES